MRIKRHGGRKVVIPAAAGDKMPEHDAPILTALSKAFHWQRLIDEGIVSSGSDIARHPRWAPAEDPESDLAEEQFAAAGLGRAARAIR